MKIKLSSANAVLNDAEEQQIRNPDVRNFISAKFTARKLQQQIVEMLDRLETIGNLRFMIGNSDKEAIIEFLYQMKLVGDDIHPGNGLNDPPLAKKGVGTPDADKLDDLNLLS
ncbi:hypothetical protein FNV43_RR20187 [Rhamnella rubrinervis]|uniref:Uncharacterized protein n=1 Tax=Rhamnella rubrinervis TaxID=2594499 RepID=A0A8K0E0N8_9ROSA|nr:hypothetical protein FNV43_RR20187 [Rhamnella rubrinervis]